MVDRWVGDKGQRGGNVAPLIGVTHCLQKWTWGDTQILQTNKTMATHMRVG